MISDQNTKEYVLKLYNQTRSTHLERFILESLELSHNETLEILSKFNLDKFGDVIEFISPANTEGLITAFEYFKNLTKTSGTHNPYYYSSISATSAFTRKISESLLINSELIGSILRRIVTYQDVIGNYIISSNDKIIDYIKSTNDLYIIDALIRNNPYQYSFALDNPAVTSDYVDKLFESKFDNASVASLLLRHSKITTTSIQKLIDFVKMTSSRNYIDLLIDSGKSTPEFIEIILKQPYNRRIDYLCRIAQNKHLSDDSFKLLTTLKYIEVKRILASDSRTPTGWIDEEIKNHKLINSIRRRKDLTDSHKKKIEDLDVIQDILE